MSCQCSGIWFNINALRCVQAMTVLIGLVENMNVCVCVHSSAINGKSSFLPLGKMTAEESFAVWAAGGTTASKAAAALRKLQGTSNAGTASSSKGRGKRGGARPAGLSSNDQRSISQAYAIAVIEAAKPIDMRASEYFPNPKKAAASRSSDGDDDGRVKADRDVAADRKSGASTSSERAAPTRNKPDLQPGRRPRPTVAAAERPEAASKRARALAAADTSSDDDDEDDDEEDETDGAAAVRAKRTASAATAVFSAEAGVGDAGTPQAAPLGAPEEADPSSSSVSAMENAKGTLFEEPTREVGAASEEEDDDDDDQANNGEDSDDDGSDDDEAGQDPRCVAARRAIKQALQEHDKRPRGHVVDSDGETAAELYRMLLRLLKTPPTVAAVDGSGLIGLVKDLKLAATPNGRLHKVCRGFIEKMRLQVTTPSRPAAAPAAKPLPATPAHAAPQVPVPAAASSSSRSSSSASASASASAVQAGLTTGTQRSAPSAPAPTAAAGRPERPTLPYTWPADPGRATATLLLGEAVLRGVATAASRGSRARSLWQTAEALASIVPEASVPKAVHDLYTGLPDTRAHVWPGCLVLACTLESAAAACAAVAAPPSAPGASVAERLLPLPEKLADSLRQAIMTFEAGVVLSTKLQSHLAAMPAPAEPIARPVVAAAAPSTAEKELSPSQTALYVGCVRRLAADLAAAEITPQSTVYGELTPAPDVVRAWARACVSKASVAAVHTHERLGSVLELAGGALQHASQPLWQALQ